MTKFFFDERFPTRIVATAPATVSKSGTTYTIGIDTSAIVGGDVYVWQVRAALQSTSSTDFHAYETSLGADLSDARRNRWEGGGRSSLNDVLSNDIKTTIGWTPSQMTNLYTLAATITG